jgi:hypothetical protein
MVMEKAKIRGNCNLLSLNSKSESVVDVDIRGRNTILLYFFPDAISNTLRLLVRFFKMSLVPLQSSTRSAADRTKKWLQASEGNQLNSPITKLVISQPIKSGKEIFFLDFGG